MESRGGCIGMQGMNGSIGRDMRGFEVEAIGKRIQVREGFRV